MRNKDKDDKLKSKKIVKARGEDGGRQRIRHVEGDVPLCMRNKEKEKSNSNRADGEGSSTKMKKKQKVKAKAQTTAAMKQTRQQVRQKVKKTHPDRAKEESEVAELK